MKATSLVYTIVVLLMLTACSDSEHEVNKDRPISNLPSTPSSALESMAGKADSAVESVTEVVEEATDATMDKAEEVAEAGGEVMDDAKEMAADTGDAVMEKAEEVAEAGGDVMDKAKEMAADTGDAAMDKADDVVAAVGGGETMDKAKEMVADVESADAMDKAEEMVKEEMADSDLMEKADGLIAGGGDVVDQAEGSVADLVDDTAAAAGVSLASVSMDEGKALAQKSGCFACHAIDRKILGPAWQDVSARYAGDQAAGKAHLLNKIAKGGKGVWADAGINAAMPPYSPRVSDENIEKLTDFILGL